MGCAKPQVATAQPRRNKVPTPCGGRTAPCFVTPANSPASPHRHSPLPAHWNYLNFPQGQVVSFLPGHALSEPVLPSRRFSSAISSRKPLHPFFLLSLGFHLLATGDLTMSYCHFGPLCLPASRDFGCIESRNLGPSFHPHPPQWKTHLGVQ